MFESPAMYKNDCVSGGFLHSRRAEKLELGDNRLPVVLILFPLLQHRPLEH